MSLNNGGMLCRQPLFFSYVDNLLLLIRLISIFQTLVLWCELTMPKVYSIMQGF
jgi:hypothetical protein